MVFTITVDNASTNDVIVNIVRRRVNGWKRSILDGEFMHLRCCDHIINLIANEGLKDLHDLISVIYNAMRYVPSSPVRLQKLKVCIEKEKIDYKGGFGLLGGTPPI